MKKVYLSLFFLINSLFVYSAEICLTQSLSSSCHSYEVNCDFTDDEQNRLASYEYGIYADVEKKSYLENGQKHKIYQANFDSLMGKGTLFTRALATCSGLVLADTSCRYASLLHYIQNSPVKTIKSLLNDYQNNCGNSNELKAFFLLSAQDGFQQTLEMPLYRKLICDFKSRYPMSAVTVFFSQKSTNQTDGIDITFGSNGQANVVVKRFNIDILQSTQRVNF